MISFTNSGKESIRLKRARRTWDTLDVSVLVQGLTEMDSRYLIEKLYNMSVTRVIQLPRRNSVKEMEAKLN
jgi:hypothetical protein